MLRLTAIGLMVLMMVGCGGPKAGDVIVLPEGASFYFDESLFREDAELDAAGTRRSDSTGHRVAKDAIVAAGRDSRVRILKMVPGGAKVGVEADGGVMQSGYVLTRDLDRSRTP